MLDRALLIVTGKGGTGRSAVTAALALRAAREGRRVLAMALLEPTGLAIHLGTTDLGYDPVEVHPGVHAMRVDRTDALDEYLHLQLRLPRLAPLGPIVKPLDILADTVPGIRDVITIGKAAHEVWQGAWDLVVADGPPLGQIMSYLRAPEVISGLVPAGSVEDQALRMRDLLASTDEAGLVITTLPEELPANETAQALAELEAEPLIDVAAVVLNRMLPPPPAVDAEPIAVHRALHADQLEYAEAVAADVTLPYLLGIHTSGEIASQLADSWPA